MLAKISCHPDDPEDALGLQLAIAHSLAGAGGAAGGAPSDQPVFDISDSDNDVKPDVKLEDGIAVAAAAAIRVRVLDKFVNPHKFTPNLMLRVFIIWLNSYFLGPAFWGRRCESPAPKFWESLPTPPIRPSQRPVDHHFGTADGDALRDTNGRYVHLLAND
jgi:hypothetical protein